MKKITEETIELLINLILCIFEILFFVFIYFLPIPLFF